MICNNCNKDRSCDKYISGKLKGICLSCRTKKRNEITSQLIKAQNDDVLRVQCKQCKKIMFNIEFDLHKCEDEQ